MFGGKATFLKCPYCNREYKFVINRGSKYTYKNKVYDKHECMYCREIFLYIENEEYIKVPENIDEAEYHSTWMV